MWAVNSTPHINLGMGPHSFKDHMNPHYKLSDREKYNRQRKTQEA